MSKATNIKCKYCHKVGFHKMSCPTQKVTVFMSDEKTDNFFEEQEKKYLNGIRDQIERLTPSDYEPMPKEIVSIFNAFIPTLEGDEAEEFIRKAESAERATIDWSKQMKKMELALKKSRIANRKLKYTKSEAPKVKRSKDVEE